MTWTLHLPIDAVPWRNMNSRSHWSKRAADVQATKWAVKAALDGAHGDVPDPPVKCTVTMRAADRRRRDADNALACVKPVVDALVDLGVLPSDDFNTIPTFEVTVVPLPSAPEWLIQLEPA